MGTELTDQEHALPLGQGFKPLVLVEPDQGQQPTRSCTPPARLTAKQLRQGHRFGLPGTVLDHTRNRDFATCHGSLQCSSRQTDSVGTFQRAQVLRYGRRCRTGRFSGGNYFHGWSSFKGIISKLTGIRDYSPAGTHVPVSTLLPSPEAPRCSARTTQRTYGLGVGASIPKTMNIFRKAAKSSLFLRGA